MRLTLRCSVQFVLAVAVLVAFPVLAQNELNREEPGTGRDPRVSDGAFAPILPGMGDYHVDVTTKSEEAQRFFDQGLALTYAFNHAEAKRSFQEAARLDPDCAMAYWGHALVLGPNLNLPMPEDVVAETYEAIQKAVAKAHGATRREQDFISALATRYAPSAAADRAQLDAAYSDAMQKVYKRYPDDPDAATLYAASIMNLMPWAYWTKDRRPRPRTNEIMTVLEKTITRYPDHAGAQHYYIHLMEEHFPEKAEASADRLIDLIPGSGHLLHMPSHIYMRVGRYADAFESNRRAVLADEGYITACRQQDFYPLSYYPHNIHFLAWAAQREGRSREALAAAKKVGEKARDASDMGAAWALHQSFLSMPVYMKIRFGRWGDLAKTPTPPVEHIFARGVWHLGRGLAHVYAGKPARAQEDLDSLRKAASTDVAAEEFVGFANASTVLRIAESILAGEMDAKRGETEKAISHFERAVRLEDSLTYNEPPDWPLPVRHYLGAVLLDAGRADEAEIVYWEDLKRNPDNGYALFGLKLALEAQNKTDEAAIVAERFAEAWKKADVQLTSSRF